ncbi:hypothetical protein CPB85DRAFT_410677 [Mucidula mucida]|nr:hypothetical protein CPB85DRAFT_410677 [Mucidula mucida]
MLHCLLLLVGILLTLRCKVALACSDQHLDPKCPAGYYPGIVVTEGQYTVPFERMYNLTGSFHHAEWYTQTNSTNQGEDNTVGATRQGNTEGFAFNETLVRAYKDSSESLIGYVNQVPLQFPNSSGGRFPRTTRALKNFD